MGSRLRSQNCATNLFGFDAPGVKIVQLTLAGLQPLESKVYNWFWRVWCPWSQACVVVLAGLSPHHPTYFGRFDDPESKLCNAFRWLYGPLGQNCAIHFGGFQAPTPKTVQLTLVIFCGQNKAPRANKLLRCWKHTCFWSSLEHICIFATKTAPHKRKRCVSECPIQNICKFTGRM